MTFKKTLSCIISIGFILSFTSSAFATDQVSNTPTQQSSAQLDETVTVDKTSLVTALSNTAALLDSKTIGTEPGNVPQEAYDSFNEAITSAAAVNDNEIATQSEVDTALTALESATILFNNAVIPHQIVSDIINFTIPSQVAGTDTDSINHTVTFHMPYGTNLNGLVPTITLREGITVTPGSGVEQDFTNPVTYTVTDQDGLAHDWIVTCIVESDSEGDGDGDNVTDLPLKTEVPQDKLWVIKFNQELNTKANVRSFIKVTNSKNKPLHALASYGTDGKSIIVSPPEGGYTPGETYTLTLSKGVASKKTGQSIKKPVRMQFTITELPSN